ncbi:MAG: sulfotransferase [Pseudomonadales bacterium]
MNQSRPRNEKQEQLQALLQKGFLALHQNEIKQASECCRQALAIKPDLVQAHFLVGLIALEAKDRKTAFSAFGSVTHLQPQHVAAWAQLAKLFMSEGQVNRADAALEQATTQASADPLVHDLVGSVYSMMGEHDAALEWHRRAVEKNPGHVPYMVNLANSLIYHGETDDAEQQLREVLKQQPANPQAHWMLSSTRKVDGDAHIKEIQNLLSTRPRGHAVNHRGDAFMHYAAGKELEDLERWEEAFEEFDAGARARRETVEFDEQNERDTFNRLEETYTADWLQSREPGNSAVEPIFILGQPRTGTTLVERVITSHSKVKSAGELQQFGLALRRLSKFRDPRRFSPELFEHAAELNPKEVGSMYMATTKKMRGNAPHFVDKLPSNYLYIPLLLAALPNAKIIHLTRDPMDACFASYKQLFADAYLHSYDQLEMARHHARYLRLMDTWQQRFPNRLFNVSYEDFAGNLEPNAHKLVDHLGLDWEDDCLNFHQQSAAVSTASAVQVREPAHTRSIGRWRRYESQLQPMLDTLKSEGLLSH